MSKAFTKEDSDSEREDDVEPAELQIPTGTKNYMTPGCADRLKVELKKLLYTDRPEMVRTVAWAASNGDRSENGDYIYGKKRLREIDRRIRFLTKRLDNAEIIDPTTQVSEEIRFGATVHILDEDGTKRSYSIVGLDESEPARGKVSWVSPLAKALLGAKVGDAVSLRTPKGEKELEVIKIEYVAID
jgi:transcription elongation factor GreB